MLTNLTIALRTGLRRFSPDDRGNTLVSFGIAFPMLAAAVGVGLDYAGAAQTRGKMQAVTDAAALYAAREFQMVQANVEKVSAVARNYASQIQGVAVDVAVDTTALTVRVTLEKNVPNMFGQLGWGNTTHVKTAATAKMTNGLPLCLLALEPKAKGAITLQKNARLTAPACVVNSNSTNSNGLISMDDAALQAGLICSAGGKVKTKNTNYAPEPKTDCPVMPDPLAGRQPPPSTTCAFTDKVVSAATETLQPGVYCGGLTVTNGATVTLSPGTFIFKDGPLLVDGAASLKGNDVSIYMKGTNANLTFDTASTIYLTAAKSGPLSGILIYDDPIGTEAPEKSGKHAKEGKSPREHSILSDDARMLLGTIYMPKGRLIIDATKPVADRSAYTVLVVQQLDLYEGPNLVLNTDYRATDVPIPEGVGPYGGKVLLTN
jgi:Flp pilus assembly protein TadG